MEARGIADAELVDGAQHSSMAELAEWHQWAEKVVVF
jgi:sulfur relay (sulfurtransferase) complex TusBCD TusD component (DsrE family)